MYFTHILPRFAIATRRGVTVGVTSDARDFDLNSAMKKDCSRMHILHGFTTFRSPLEMMQTFGNALQGRYLFKALAWRCSTDTLAPLSGSKELCMRCDAVHGDVSPEKIRYRRLANNRVQGCLVDYDYYIPRSSLKEDELPRTGV
ncbi:hypothetical protein NMY22_g333 [Coprinellus aureogranulatus]|nr:hypothetical protein NMY22_g333 [Coprinellus aureogranulatus]